MTDIKKVVEGLEEITRYDGKQMSLGDNDVFIRGMAQEAIDVLNEQKQKIEEQEKKIEDQEERIAIMTEGNNNKKVSILQSELYNCRNELCIKCGLYRRSHEGVCNGCRYRHDGEWKEGLE